MSGDPIASRPILSALWKMVALATLATFLAVAPSAAHEEGDGEFISERPLDRDCNKQDYPVAWPVGTAGSPGAYIYPRYSRITAIDLCLEVHAGVGEATVSIVSRATNGDIVREWTSADFVPDGGGILGRGVAWQHIDLDEPFDHPFDRYGLEIIVDGVPGTFSWLATCDELLTACSDTGPQIFPRLTPNPRDHAYRLWTDTSSNMTVSIEGPVQLCRDYSNIDDVVVTVTNTGEQRNNPPPSDLYVGDVMVGDYDHPLFRFPMNPGESDTATGRVYLSYQQPLPELVPGPSELRVVLDPDDTLVESNESDNAAVIPTTVVTCG